VQFFAADAPFLMPSKVFLSRRDAVKHAAVAALALPLLGSPQNLSAQEKTASAPPRRGRSHAFKFGVATISLKDLPVAQVASVLKQLDLGYASLFRTHAYFEKGTAEDCRAAAQALRDGGVTPSATSVVNLNNNEAAARKAFDNTRAAGIPLMICKPTPDSLPLVTRLAKEYDIRLAIHNHGPEDKLYPSPYDAWKVVASLDPQVGLCLDLGHAMRAGADPVEAIHRCAPRIYDVHLKDSLAAPGAEDIPAIVGRGHMDIRGILAALIEIKYSGVVAFEYEVAAGNPIAGLAESVGYVRGTLAAL
jgi:sugar phosphate isomerase/epimerase